MRDWIASSEALRTVGLESHAAASALKRVLFAEVIWIMNVIVRMQDVLKCLIGLMVIGSLLGEVVMRVLRGEREVGVLVGYECPRLI